MTPAEKVSLLFASTFSYHATISPIPPLTEFAPSSFNMSGHCMHWTYFKRDESRTGAFPTVGNMTNKNLEYVGKGKSFKLTDILGELA